MYQLGSAGAVALLRSEAAQAAAAAERRLNCRCQPQAATHLQAVQQLAACRVGANHFLVLRSTAAGGPSGAGWRQGAARAGGRLACGACAQPPLTSACRAYAWNCSRIASPTEAAKAIVPARPRAS